MGALEDWIYAGEDYLRDKLRNTYGHRLEDVSATRYLFDHVSGRYDETHETQGPDANFCTLHTYSHKIDVKVRVLYEVTVRVGANRYTTYLWELEGEVKGIQYNGSHMQYPWPHGIPASVPEEEHEYVVRMNDEVIWTGTEYPHVQVKTGGEVFLNFNHEPTREVFASSKIFTDQEQSRRT